MSGGVSGVLNPFTPPIFNPEGQIINPDQIVSQQGRPKRLRAYCKVYFNGQDITSRLDPVLLSVRITDRKAGQSLCSLAIDDKYGTIPNPPDGAKLYIEIGWPNEGTFKNFNGYMTDVLSQGQRRGGRILTIEATSQDQLGNGKTPITMSWGAGNDGKGEEKSFREIAEEVAKKAGISNLNIAQSIGDIKRKFWSVDGEPPLQWLERTAKELGGAFKPEGENAGIVANDGKDALGQTMDAVACTVGENVFAWGIRPKAGRAQWGSAWHGFFDRDKAAWRTAMTKIAGGFGFGNAKAQHMGGWPTNNEDMAKTVGQGDASASILNRGTGWIAIDGEPRAFAGGRANISGCRPGVDGGYGMKEVEHSWHRGGGYVTRLDVEDPTLFDSSSVTGGWEKPK